ncbi:MAG TPA: tail fiber domain-containing protein, partial [Casimicrobiaceae bacterium]|nr:tail fiber domain-containing protein [Casimicrobiaceae bacterium]
MSRKLFAACTFAATSAVAPAHAQTCTPFTDVAASNIFCSNIQWMFNRGVTLGCGPNLFCPSDLMPREQMAAFLNRLADKVVFQQGGNAFSAAAELGTTDNQPLEIIVNDSRVMRYEPHAVSPNVIGGHPSNNIIAGVRGATIGGGGVSTDPDFALEGPNRVTSVYGTVAGGYNNQAGSESNIILLSPFASVGGGIANRAFGPYSTVGGGDRNIARGDYSTASGGINNRADGPSSTIGGGNTNLAPGFASTVPGGNDNTASGDYSFAAGRKARATTHGSFIWADSSNFDFQPSVNNFFGVRATGGAGITVAINPSNGAVTQFCNLLPGVASWQCTSDRDAKENFEPVAREKVLEKLAAMPLFAWNFKGADRRLRNLGPTAQDFHAAFGLGTDDKAIASGNLHGVALAAVQGLNDKVERLVAQVASLNSELAQQQLARETQAREIIALRSALAGFLPADVVPRNVETVVSRSQLEARIAARHS